MFISSSQSTYYIHCLAQACILGVYNIMLTCFYSKGALLYFFGFPFPVVCCFCVFEWSAKATFPKSPPEGLYHTNPLIVWFFASSAGEEGLLLLLHLVPHFLPHHRHQQSLAAIGPHHDDHSSHTCDGGVQHGEKFITGCGGLAFIPA